jgi:hypothetical protein
MKSLKSVFVVFSSVGLLFLAACSGSQTTSSSSPDPNSTPAPAASQKTDSMMPDSEKKHGGMSDKGMVVEVGAYHLELVPEPETEGTHLDLFLQKGDNHAAIPDAKVTAEVQLPDGGQKSLPMKYDAEDKHYTALLPTTATGEYKVAILSNINGENVNARYSFSR